MKIQYCSDLHLEFDENKMFIAEHPIKPLGEILILAGDIIPFAVIERADDFFDYCSANFEFVYWIPGNHEYYYSDIVFRSGAFKEKIRTNVFLVNNTAVNIGDVKFIFTTLWSAISAANSWTIQRGMSDFDVIKMNNRSFNVIDYNELHKESVAFISKQLLTRKAEKTIVVTHHVPTFLNYPEKYKGNALSEAFAVELFDLIQLSDIDYWLYGHHHSNIPTFTIGKTKLITNQLGYVKYQENAIFGNKMIAL